MRVYLQWKPAAKHQKTTDNKFSPLDDYNLSFVTVFLIETETLFFIPGSSRFLHHVSHQFLKV